MLLSALRGLADQRAVVLIHPVASGEEPLVSLSFRDLNEVPMARLEQVLRNPARATYAGQRQVAALSRTG